jgi:hypothetical protein
VRPSLRRQAERHIHPVEGVRCRLPIWRATLHGIGTILSLARASHPSLSAQTVLSVFPVALARGLAPASWHIIRGVVAKLKPLFAGADAQLPRTAVGSGCQAIGGKCQDNPRGSAHKFFNERTVSTTRLCPPPIYYQAPAAPPVYQQAPAAPPAEP